MLDYDEEVDEVEFELRCENSDNGTEPNCPECGTAMIVSGHCATCPECGWSLCSM